MARFTCSFISYSLMRSVDMTVIIPTPTYLDALGKGGTPWESVRHTPKEKYPVLYLLHGIGNHHMGWTSYTNIELYAEEQQIAVVLPSAENKHYADQPHGDNFYQLLEKELPDFVCGMFPVSSRWEDTYIAGLSMGGYGALIHGLSNPQRYMAIGAFSPALHINPAEDNAPLALSPRPPQYDPLSLAESLCASGNRFPMLYLSCGEEDFLFELNTQYRDALSRMNVAFTWSQTPGYGHEWRFWNQEIERFLDWLPRTDAYAKKRRHC